MPIGDWSVAKERLTDAALRNQREQALRAFRRIQRGVDTTLEKIERQLDRAIENKEKITIRLTEGIDTNFKDFVKRVNEMAEGLADMINIFLGK